MRKELQKINEERKTFIGTFDRFDVKNGYMRQLQTILLKDVYDLDNNYIADHLWFTYIKGFQNLGVLNNGDRIKFTARVKQYEKGYKGYRDDVYKPIELDYKLSHPTKIEKIK